MARLRAQALSSAARFLTAYSARKRPYGITHRRNWVILSWSKLGKPTAHFGCRLHFEKPIRRAPPSPQGLNYGDRHPPPPPRPPPLLPPTSIGDRDGGYRSVRLVARYRTVGIPSGWPCNMIRKPWCTRRDRVSRPVMPGALTAVLIVLSLSLNYRYKRESLQDILEA